MVLSLIAKNRCKASDFIISSFSVGPFFTRRPHLHHTRSNITASTPKLLEGYEAAFALGDMECVTGILQLYAGVAIWGCGDKLTKVEKILRIHARRMLQHKQYVSCKNIMPHLQQTAELFGSKEDIFLTFFNTRKEDFFQQEMNRRGAHTIQLIMPTILSHNACLFLNPCSLHKVSATRPAKPLNA